MIAETIFQHILKTLNLVLFRPVLVLCRDCAQQQPFSKHNVRIMQLPSPFTNKHFISTTYRYNLLGQHHVGDAQYLKFLNSIRNWVPNQNVLDDIQEGCVICQDDIVTDEDIFPTCVM